MIKRIIFLASAACLLGSNQLNAQLFGKLQNDVPRDRDGVNVFGPVKDDTPYEGIKVNVGGAFTMQFQGLDHENDGKNLAKIGNSFNLPTANMTLGAQLYDGVQVNLDFYLSARHHRETWVKGGYLQIDKLDFIKPGFAEDIMKYTTIKVGQMENDYGDAHFRRSDNGNALKNPLIGNNIMDAYVTEIGMEVHYNRGTFVGMAGITNSKMSQSVAKESINSPAYLLKLGFDKKMDDNFRVRLTGSMHFAPDLVKSELYAGDRAGSRFYSVITHDAITNPNGSVDPSNFDPVSNFTTGRVNPGFVGRATSFMINPFVKYHGLEIFGTYEHAVGGDSNSNKSSNRSWNQYVAELLYRFGGKDQFYVAGKYNNVSGKLKNADLKKVSVDRFEAGAGWFMTKNILAKAAYVNQQYNDYQDKYFKGAEFKGYMIEAVISF